MDKETVMFYHFKGCYDNEGVNVLSYVNNIPQAYEAMLRCYNRTKENTPLFINGENKRCSNWFDGRKYR